MESVPRLRMRQVHLDFHTAPSIPDVGTDFDAREFARIVQAAHVDSMTVFAKCHHGMSYYPTQVGVMHPALSFDLLGAQIEALHGIGVRAPIYISVGWDEHMADEHPEWRQVDCEGRFVGKGPFDVMGAATRTRLHGPCPRPGSRAQSPCDGVLQQPVTARTGARGRLARGVAVL